MPKPAGFEQEEGTRFRIRYGKVGRGAFIAQLDTMRLLIRVFRRAGVEMIYSKGFHPKPLLSFAPALGLGVASLSEICDVRVLFDDADQLADRLRAAAPEGLVIDRVRKLSDGEPALAKVLATADFAAWLPSRVEELRSGELIVKRMQKGREKIVDVAKHLVEARVSDDRSLASRLEWPADGTLLEFRLKLGAEGGAKPSEVVEALTGAPPPDGARYARTALTGEGSSDLLA
jgi:radical SAM-linked protein